MMDLSSLAVRTRLRAKGPTTAMPAAEPAAPARNPRRPEPHVPGAQILQQLQTDVLVPVIGRALGLQRHHPRGDEESLAPSQLFDFGGE